MILQGSSVDNNSTLHADYCIIGSGMGGSATAATLARAGKDVLLVEAGQSEPAPGAPAHQAIASEHTGRSFGVPLTRCIELGGTSNAWHGICTPLEEIDFEPRPWIQDSGWPIRRTDLDPFYAEAARLFGHERLSGLHPERLPSAIQHALRAIDSDPSVLQPKLLEYRTSPFRWKQTLLDLAHSGKLRCLLNTSALELVPSENGSRIVILKAAAAGRTIRIEANNFIVSAGALETPRLLLNSRSHSPQGVGNDRGLVGRYLMDHPTGPFNMLRFEKTLRALAYSGLPMSGDRQLMAALTLSPGLQHSAQVPNHYFLVRPSIGPNHVEHNLRLSFLAARGVRDFTPRQVAGILTTPNLLYRILVQRCSFPAYYRYGELFFFAEQMPNPESRIRLSTKSRDAHGYPIASIHWEPCAKDIASLAHFARTVLSRGLQSPQYQITSDNHFDQWTQQYTSAAHHLGTARMADQPCRGVVDRNLQVFGVNNLYVCDGSVFATSGSANPSLTITALALRLADHLLSRPN